MSLRELIRFLRAALLFSIYGCVGDSRDGAVNPTEDYPQFDLDSVPHLRIAAIDGQPLYRLAAVEILPTGQYIVTTRTDPTVFVLDKDGKQIARLGRSGKGPGEFLSINGIAYVEPDTLLILDSTLRRVTQYTLNGTVTDVVALASPTPRVLFGGYRLAGVLSNGHLLIVPDAIPARRQPVPGVYMDSAALLIYGRDGVFKGTFGPYWRMEMVSTEQGATRRPLGFVSAFAMTESYVYLASEPRPEVTVYDAKASPVHSVQWAAPVRAVSDNVRDSYINELVRGARGGDERNKAIAWYRQLPWPRELPYFGSDLIVSTEGDIVIEEPLRHPNGTAWRIVAENGKTRGLLVTPKAFRVHDLHADRLAGVWTDSLGVEELRVYRFRRSRLLGE